jgi:hypothetical protein
VRFVAGHSEVMPGPATLFEDPLEHMNIFVKPAKSINNNEALVVYRESELAAKGGGKTVLREIVRGPVLYKPKHASEWTHQFSWHGHDPSGDSQQLARKRPHALKFEKLLLAPSSTYFDVEHVRTADDALLTVRLMIFCMRSPTERSEALRQRATAEPCASVCRTLEQTASTALRR